MHRNNLLNLLNNYFPTDTEELFYRKKILDFVRLCENCFERTCSVGHITASGFVLNHDCTKFLLLHHKKHHQWLQAGGHCDGDSDTLRVAVKEVNEETGIIELKPLMDGIFDLDMHLIPQYGTTAPHYHYDIRFLLRATNDLITANDESNAVRWFDLHTTDLPHLDESVVRMLNKCKNIQLS